MINILRVIFLLFIVHNNVLSQVFPKEGSKLHYRIVGFAFPEKGTATLEIASGHYDDAAKFKKNIVRNIKCRDGRAVAEVHSFGCDYTWRVRGKADGSLHHFSTLMRPIVDTAINRMRLTRNSDKYNGKYFFVDVAEALYDMQGRPVWFLPDIPQIADKRGMVRDLKITQQHTITFLANNKIFEINYNGDILWQGPSTGEISGEQEDFYHHEFTRLSHGHYMVMGAENVAWEVPCYDDTAYLKIARDIFRGPDNKYYRKIQLGTLIEYDSLGKIVWSWKTSTFAKDYGFYLLQTFGKRESLAGGHENSFFFDEKNGMIYMGYRDLSSIVKIKYPEGKILAVYRNTSGNKEELFYGQHSVKVAVNGDILVFNNNTHTNSAIPKVVVLQEDKESGHCLKKIWEYQPTADLLASDKMHNTYKQLPEANHIVNQPDGKVKMTSGGNFMELGDGIFFASMNFLYENKPFSVCFIVSKDKKILWNAVIESRIPGSAAWGSKVNYRASLVGEQDLAELIYK